MRGFLALALLVLAACASIPGGELRFVDEPECIVVSDRVSYRMEGQGRLGIGAERGLFPGVYPMLPTYQNLVILHFCKRVINVVFG